MKKPILVERKAHDHVEVHTDIKTVITHPEFEVFREEAPLGLVGALWSIRGDIGAEITLHTRTDSYTFLL